MKKESKKRLSYRIVSMLIAGMLACVLCACSGSEGLEGSEEAAVLEEPATQDKNAVSEDVAKETEETAEVDASEDTKEADELEAAEEADESEASEEKSELEDNKASDSADEGWKELMREAVDSKLNEYWEYNQDEEITDEAQYYEGSSFALLYIDDDEIPEIYVMPASGMMDGSSILYLKDGDVASYDIGWSDSIDYTPYSGKICLYHGQHVPAMELILTFPDEKELGSGAFAEPGWYDNEDHSVDGADMEYMWDDEFVSEKEYNEIKSGLFDGDIHSAYDEKAITYDELMKVLAD